MGKFIVKVESVEMTCPACHETIPSPSGSLFWIVAEIPPPGVAIKCESCGNESQIPAQARALFGGRR